MPKTIKSPTAAKYAKEYLAVEKFPEKASDKNEEDLQKIGLRKFRLWGKIVEPIRWSEKEKIVEVLVDGRLSRYAWPFHKCFEPFFNFEVLDDINYLDRFSNGERVNSRYGVIGDMLMVDGRYLGTERFIKRFSEMGIVVEKTEKWII